MNKVLALAGRDEPRNFLDINYINREIISLGALCWAACGKDPGFSPTMLLESLQNRHYSGGKGICIPILSGPTVMIFQTWSLIGTLIRAIISWPCPITMFSAKVSSGSRSRRWERDH